MKLSIDGRFSMAARAAFVTGLAVAAMPAFAQEAAPTPVTAAEPAAAAPAEAAPVAEAALPVAALPTEAAVATKSESSVKLEKVQVTGSRIRRVDAEGATPIVTIDIGNLRRLKNT